MIKPTYYLQGWQESAFNVYMDKYGIDAGIEVMQEFEETGDLGWAMIHVTKKIKQAISQAGGGK